MSSKIKKLVIGIGNINRGDDGLGWQFLEALRQRGIQGWELIERSQLTADDAELLMDVETLVFVDSYNGKLEKGYHLEECHPRVGQGTTRTLNPCAVLALTNNLYKRRPTTFVMQIQGFEWGIGQGLSPRAAINLEKSADYFARKFNRLNPA